MKVSYEEDLANYFGLGWYADRGNTMGVVSGWRVTQASYRAPKSGHFVCRPGLALGKTTSMESL